jgi:hypothetical protein
MVGVGVKAFIKLCHKVCPSNIPLASNFSPLPPVSTQKRTDIFDGKMPNLVGKFSIASRAPNVYLKAPLEISGFVDVDRLFKHAKRTFYDREIDFENISTFNSAEGRILTS